MFDLERAIQEWRAPFTRRHIYAASDISELEMHLRDVVAEELARGLAEPKAFEVAVLRVGDEERLRSQYEQSWKELSPLKRYWKALLSEFKGWNTRRSLIGYGVARTLSLFAGLITTLFLIVVGVSLSRGLPLLTSGEPLNQQALLFLSALSLFASAFNLFPFKQWTGRSTDWLRLIYATIVLTLVPVLLLLAPGSIDTSAWMGLLINGAIFSIGPVLWLKQIVRLRDHQPDLDDLVVSG